MRKSSKSHSFDTQIAIEVGVEAAIVLNHFHYWIEHNRIAGTAQENGTTWTFQSLSAMGKYLPYLSQKQLRNAIDKLVDAGYVIKGKFNKNKFDQTAWYTIPESKPSEDSNKEFDVPETANACLPEGQINEPETADASIYNKNRKEEEKQQQQHSAAAVVCHPSLKNLDIPFEDKEEISKRYPDETIVNAVGWALDPDNPPEKCLSASIKFACKKGLHFEPKQKKPLPEKQEVSQEKQFENKSIAKDFIRKNWIDELIRTSVDANVEYVQVKNDKIYYSDPKFEMLFEHACRKIN